MFNNNSDNAALLSSEIFTRYINKIAADRNGMTKQIEQLELAINEDPKLCREMAMLQRELYAKPETCNKIGVKVARIVMALNINGGFDDIEDVEEAEEHDPDWVEEADLS